MGVLRNRRFYVYTLSHPVSETVFYVGKGKGSRCHHHVKEAKRGGKQSNQRKADVILAILAIGLEPKVDIVAWYDVEEDAFQHEIELIAVTPGLTNICRGGQGAALPYEEARRRLLAREYSKNLSYLTKMLKVWDKWPDVTFPNVKDGTMRAREFVEMVRGLVAQPG